MSDTEQLRTLGQQLATALVASYGATAPGSKLVFLPGGVSVPHDIVQAGLVNPTQMQTWLAINFDAPFLVSGAQGSVLEKDPSHGAASRIYAIAASTAQPLGDPANDDWKRVDGEIAAAQRSLGPPDAQKSIVCEPDDWPLPASNAGYWTKFDSSETETTSTQTTRPVPVVSPQFWMVRSLAAAPVAAPDPPPEPSVRQPLSPLALEKRATVSDSISPVLAARSKFAGDAAAMSLFHPALARSVETISMAESEPRASATLAATATSVDSAALVTARPQLQAWRLAADRGALPERLEARAMFQIAVPIDKVTTSTSSTVTIHLEHQCVSLGYFSAGTPWWDGVFLADRGWFVPGMTRGGLLPAPTDGGDLAYGLPTALVIVQNLRVSGKWSAEAAAALSSPGGTMGPLSLFGPVASTEADGVTVTYAHDGMQVVALLCSAIPVLPPVDAPHAPPPPP